MKRLPVVILVVVAVLGAVVSGCRNTPRYDGRLAAADSLMRGDADSALALLEALPLSDLHTAGDSAYRDLLLTQARYRAYVTATSDSDINRALAYYRARPAEREKLTRAYIYKGAVMEELGHPDSAMLYYKYAEMTADTTDYFNLGYCNLRIAQLYQHYYSNDSAVVSRMKVAARYFMAIRDTNYLITTIGMQGSYPKILGKDSADIYLKRAVDLSKKIKSTKGLQYQSKLAGSYFYNGNYRVAKELAMDIVKNNSEKCNERQFYYYAARSYIRLNLIDSARWLISMIPAPNDAVDSMNYYQMLADLSQATHRYSDYTRYNEKANEINTRILEDSRDSKLTEIELKYDASQHEAAIRKQANYRLAFIIGLVMLAVALLSTIAVVIIKSRINLYRRQLDSTRLDLEKLIGDIDLSRNRLEAEIEKNKCQLAKKDNELAEMSRKKLELEQEKESINKQVSAIVRYRQAALNELYQSIRITSVNDEGRKRALLLVTTIRELYEKKGILQTPPTETFWNNLRRSVDGEFEGIASFVEQNYPNFSAKDMQLFLLLCADFPNQIIKMCMNYTHDVTVSKNKKKLVKEKFGLDVKFDEFIQMYLSGQLHPDRPFNI